MIYRRKPQRRTKLQQEAVGGDPNRFSEQKSKKCQKYVDYRKRFKYSVSDGSILAYYNGADYTFTWEQGRQLASVTKGNKTASYTYDMSGVRSGKVVNGVSYEYTTLSGKITRMTWSGNAVDIVYDDAGRPYILRYTPSGGATQTYYYVLNLQGDVVGLMNTSMQMVVKYSYDPWGKLTGTTATSAYVALAQANPLRYRSYCYDIETGFYYLQTRYYDPAIARFINADSYLSTDSTGLLSYNMFAYCENNPVMRSDPTGEAIAHKVVIGILSGAVSGIIEYWIETVLFDEEFEIIEAAKYATIGAATGCLEEIFPKYSDMIGGAEFILECFNTIISGEPIYDILVSLGYDTVHYLISAKLDDIFKGNAISDEIAHAIAELIITGNDSALKNISRSAIREAYEDAQNKINYIVSSPGSARTKVHCER